MFVQSRLKHCRPLSIKQNKNHKDNQCIRFLSNSSELINKSKFRNKVKYSCILNMILFYWTDIKDVAICGIGFMYKYYVDILSLRMAY